MGEVLIKILNMGIVASWMILAVVLLRIILKNAPKWIRCFMWGLVAIRLAFPFSIESKLSLVPNIQQVDTSRATSVSYISPVTEKTAAESVDVLTILAIVWIAGIVLMLLYMLISYINIRVRIADRVKVRDNIWMCRHIDTPFVMGIFLPQIYILSDMGERETAYVIAHETAHIQRMDNIWKPISFLLLSIHWFNPLCWLAYILFCRDMELSCDEKVIKNFDVESKKEYSRALLSCSTKKYMISVCPMVFGENNVKKRILDILKYKKPAISLVVMSFVVVSAVCTMFMTNPVSNTVVSEPEVTASVNSQKRKNKSEKAEIKTPGTEPSETKTSQKPTKEIKATQATTKPFSVSTQPTTVAEVYETEPYDEILKEKIEQEYRDSRSDFMEKYSTKRIEPEKYTMENLYGNGRNNGFATSPTKSRQPKVPVIPWDVGSGYVADEIE